MRILLNMTDDELIARIKNNPEYLIDREDVMELIKRFEANLNMVYQAEQILDATK